MMRAAITTRRGWLILAVIAGCTAPASPPLSMDGPLSCADAGALRAMLSREAEAILSDAAIAGRLTPEDDLHVQAIQRQRWQLLVCGQSREAKRDVYRNIDLTTLIAARRDSGDPGGTGAWDHPYRRKPRPKKLPTSR